MVLSFSAGSKNRPALKVQLLARLIAIAVVHTLRKINVSMKTSSSVGQCAPVFSILILFNYPLNKAACPPGPVNTVYSPIMPSEVIYTLMRIY